MSALLPEDNTQWPPASAAGRYRRMKLPRAWYSGDPGQLRSAYGVKVATRAGGLRTTLNPGGGAQRVIGTNADSFWADNPTSELDTRRHLPIAQDIATISADQLFSDPPTVRVMGPTDAEGRPSIETRAAQQRLDRVLELCRWDSLLIASAEIASALGSTGLRIAFDKTAAAIADRPVIARVTADAVIPHYSWGQLVGVTFWQVVRQDRERDEVWRHLEVHEAGTGMVYHGLYKGDTASIGERQRLDAQPATAHLGTEDDPMGVGGIRVVSAGRGKTATSIPNMLPDPMDLNDEAGRSDFTLPVMDLFDAADKAYTQLMDEVDDAKSRLLIADSMLERGKAGQGVSFDPNQRIFNRVKMPPQEKEGGGLPIEKVQFEMRVTEYLALIDALTWKAIDAAGFNPNTEREGDGAAMTATEVSSRNLKSRTTRDKKVRYWEGELEELLTTLLLVDVEQFAPWVQVETTRGEGDAQVSTVESVRVQAFPVQVQFPEAVQPTLRELAETASALREAGESVLEIQRVLHPDWSERQLRDNVDLIQRAASVIDPVSFGAAGAGVGPGDGV